MCPFLYNIFDKYFEVTQIQMNPSSCFSSQALYLCWMPKELNHTLIFKIFKINNFNLF